MQELKNLMQQQLEKMAATGKLFRSKITGKEVWDLYLSSFEDDPVFRDPESSTHNCNLCGNFIRRYGNIVAIGDDMKVMSIWDLDLALVPEEYTPSCRAVSKSLQEAAIQDVFFETYDELNSLPYEKCTKHNESFRLGIDKNVKQYTREEAEKFGVVNTKDVYTFHHLHLDLPKAFVDLSGKSVEAIMAYFRDDKNVFQRAMETISADTLLLVQDLINQGSLLDGTTHLHKIAAILPMKQDYDAIPVAARDNWCWFWSYKFQFAKFRNELIGVLCSELSEGMEINAACLNWNKRVDPANYMKATAPITQKQIAEAKQFVEDNGYGDSFARRFATIDDIKATEVLHSNVGTDKLKPVSVFDSVKATSTRHKRNEFDGVEEVQIEKFMKDILPGCTAVHVYLENRHEGNLVSLTTADNKESKPIFKWDNNYSWTYKGNLAGKSQIKEEVKSKGGKVDGVLRFSMMWADGNGDNSDLDLHCVEPRNKGIHICYEDKRSYATGGNLDIDITQPGGKLAVENITYPSLSKMPEGTYQLFIRQFSARGSKGFKAEIEFDGQLYSYDYPRPVIGDIQIAEVTLKNGQFSIVHKLPATDGAGVIKEIYGLETNQFHKVNLLCLSPNHWGSNVGNKHYFFMLQGCKADVPIRGFHNENLIGELLDHRKVMEILGATTTIPITNNQLSGLGFNSTVKDEVILKLEGNFKRTIKLKF